jgi:hypothetical protein
MTRFGTPLPAPSLGAETTRTLAKGTTNPLSAQTPLWRHRYFRSVCNQLFFRHFSLS